MKKKLIQPFQLCLLALGNYGLFYGLTVYLARSLDTRGFHDYSVAVATVALLSSLATLGLEKYALRILPAAFEAKKWGEARGFVHFGSRWLLAVSALVGGAYIAIRYATTRGGDNELWPVLIGVAAVPAVAFSQFLIEVLASTGRVVRATFFYRFFFPLVVVASVFGLAALRNDLTASTAVAAYSAAWVLILALLFWQVRASLPTEIWSAEVVKRPKRWLAESAPFLVHSVMMTQFASLGIIGLEFAGRGERSVALLSAAMQTSGFVVLLATATNRYYSPRGSIMIEQQDMKGIQALMRERWIWLVPVTLVYLMTMVLFGRRILGFFGPGFEDGYPALVWIAAGASVSVVFAMASTYLKFVRKHRMVLGITAVAALVNVSLILLLGPRYGATGAAIGYAVSIGGMAILFAVLGIYSVKRQIERA